MKLRSDRREARRQGAYDRFKILNWDQWATREQQRNPRAPTHNEAHGAYVERKMIEGEALGFTRLQMAASVL